MAAGRPFSGLGFDNGKEEIVIIHPTQHHGEDFKLLGTWVDTAITMGPAVQKTVQKAKPKLRSLLRSRPYHTTPQMVLQYKAHILCLLEFPTGAVYHATASVLSKLDQVQNSFLRELGLDADDA